MFDRIEAKLLKPGCVPKQELGNEDELGGGESPGVFLLQSGETGAAPEG